MNNETQENAQNDLWKKYWNVDSKNNELAVLCEDYPIMIFDNDSNMMIDLDHEYEDRKTEESSFEYEKTFGHAILSIINETELSEDEAKFINDCKIEYHSDINAILFVVNDSIQYTIYPRGYGLLQYRVETDEEIEEIQRSLINYIFAKLLTIKTY